jgi:hypothetical protein
VFDFAKLTNKSVSRTPIKINILMSEYRNIFNNYAEKLLTFETLITMKLDEDSSVTNVQVKSKPLRWKHNRGTSGLVCIL